MKKIVSPFLMLLMLTLVSCGDLFMKNNVKKDVGINEFISCEMDTEAIMQIMKKNIRGELTCLENSLKFFVDAVDTDRYGYLSYDELKLYIERHMPEVDDETIVGLSGIFDLNTLMFGDDHGYIERKNITKLTKVMIQFNEVAVEAKLFDYFSSKDRVSFDEHNHRKNKIYSAFVKIRKIFGQALVKNNKAINLNDFIDKFVAIGNKEIIANIKSLLFLKRAIVGGSKNIMTAAEFKTTVEVLPDTLKIAFDFVNFPKTDTDSVSQDEAVLKILKEDIAAARRSFYFKDQPDAYVMDYNDLLGIAERFFPRFVKYVKYKDSVLVLKQALLGEVTPECKNLKSSLKKANKNDFFPEKCKASGVFNARSILYLLDEILYKNLEKGVNFYKFYEQNQVEMNSFFKISRPFKLRHYVDYNKEKKQLAEFNRIAQNYKYYLGSEFSPSYDVFFQRNPRGVYEIAMLEGLVTSLFKAFGTKNHNVLNGYALTIEQLEEVMVQMSDLFEGEGWILPGRVKGTAETISIMTSLFHHQSDGDSLIEVNEFTEFAITMLTSMNLSSKMFEIMPKFCEVSKEGRYTPQCFRDNIKGIMGELVTKVKSVNNYMPKLEKYLHSLDKSQIDEYFIKTAKFSRTCSTFEDGTERLMRESDGIVTWAGLIAIEQSMLRFDRDNTDILEPKELDEAYKIYEAAIKGLIPVESLKGQAKKVFQYMIKYKKVPEVPEVRGFRSFWRAVARTFTFARFAWFRKPRNRLADADRMTFAAVLEIIAENSPSALENPYPCETLR